MVAAGDELRSILEGDLVGWLARFPLGKHLCIHKMPKAALPHRTVDGIVRSYSPNRFVRAVRHEDSRLRRYAEGTLVLTTSIRVDRPLKTHTFYAIEDGLYLDFDPLDLSKITCSRRLDDTRMQRG